MDFVFRRSYRGPIRLAVFDWAGTTVDFGSRAPIRPFVEAFKLRGVDVTSAEVRVAMGMRKKDHLAAIAKLEAVAQRWRTVHGRDCTDDDVADMYETDFRRLQLACLAEHSELIPGTLDCVGQLKQRGIHIGSSSGYFTEAMEILRREAERQGYRPDAAFCASDVPAGRPEPWMLLANMQATRTFPPEAVVKIGDTTADIAEGLNAGAWTVGVAKTGNEVGLSEAKLAALPGDVREARIARARERLYQHGAHSVVDEIAELPTVIDRIDERLADGDRP